MKRKICIVEDDEGIVEVYTGALEDQYDLEFFDNGKDFLKRMMLQNIQINSHLFKLM